MNAAITPELFYVFVNLAHPICHMNVEQAKSISSAAFGFRSDPAFLQQYRAGTADYFPFVPNPNASCKVGSMYQLSATSQYEVEYNAERVRRLFFPLASSRLSAIYAFGSHEDCELAHKRHHWDLDTVRRFRLQPDPLNRVARVNMEIVSLMRTAYTRINRDEALDTMVWKHYWSGGGSLDIEMPCMARGSFTRKTFASGVLWEYLIEGHLTLDDPNVTEPQPAVSVLTGSEL